MRGYLVPKSFLFLLSILLLSLTLGYGSAYCAEDVQSALLQVIQKSAIAGDANAQARLGALYYEGLGARQDYAKAREWFEKASNHGHAYAQWQLGKMYAAGESVEQDYSKAKEWFEKSCTNGYAAGCDEYEKLRLE